MKNKNLQGTDRTGWCITGHHNNCPKVVKLSMGTASEKICGCSCHEEQGEENGV